MILTKLNNLEQYKGLTKLKANNASIKKALENNYIVKTNAQAHIVNNILSLEEEYQNNKLIDKIDLKGNSKLGEIPSISFPNIFIQQQFMILCINNPKILELKSVSILHDYFKENKICLNCENCFGACYNNYDINQYPQKAISDLRALLAFITDKESLLDSLYKRIRVYNIFRINSNGEIHNIELLDFYIRLANKCKRTTFYTYTKSYELFNSYIENGNKLPKNFILNISVFENKNKVEKFFNLTSTFNKFVTMVNDELDQLIKTGKVKKNRVCKGDCMECDLCQKNLPKKNNTIYCYKHL